MVSSVDMDVACCIWFVGTIFFICVFSYEHVYVLSFEAGDSVHTNDLLQRSIVGRSSSVR